jgi:hypothetical protein
MIKGILLAAAAVACLFLSACDVTQGLLNDDNYTHEVTIQGRWQVRYNGEVTVEQDTDGSVNVFGYASGSDSHPDVKVSGTGVVFKVFEAHNVKADDGTTVQAYYSTLVKASHGSNVQAYNCGQVVGAYDATVAGHGHTSVNMLDAPRTAAPAAPAAPAGTAPAAVPPAQPAADAPKK